MLNAVTEQESPIKQTPSLQKNFAKYLKAALLECNYEQIIKQYLDTSFNNVPYVNGYFFHASSALFISGLSEAHKKLVSFFHFGEKVSTEILREELKSSYDQFLQLGEEIGLLSLRDEQVQLNYASVYVVPVLGESIFVLASRPRAYNYSNVPRFLDDRPHLGRVHIGKDSYLLKNKLPSRKDKLRGIIVDAGAASGIQALTALMLSDDIEHVYALEQDSLARDLCAINAIMSGNSDRLSVVGSIDELHRNFQDNQKIDCVITNPPYLMLPDSYSVDSDTVSTSSIWPVTINGGRDGLKVMKEFIVSLLPYLSDKGGFIVNAVFAGQDDEPTLALDFMRSQALTPTFEPHRQIQPRTFANWVEQHVRESGLLEYDDDGGSVETPDIKGLTDAFFSLQREFKVSHFYAGVLCASRG